jgi:hypothetical protein
MGQKGYDYVKKYYSWDVVMEKIRKQLESIISNVRETPQL